MRKRMQPGTVSRIAVLTAVPLVVLFALAAVGAGLRAATRERASETRFEGFWGPLYRIADLLDFDRVLDERRRSRVDGPLERVKNWNRIAVDASGLDHTPTAPGETRVFGEQIGPGRASRAMAIVHIAIFDAMDAILGGYQPYDRIAPAPPGASVDAAIAQAAHDALVAMYPSQAASFDVLLAQDLATLPATRSKRTGIGVGRRAAAAILAQREHDGSHHPEPAMDADFHPSDAAGKWRQDPVSLVPVALGAHWGEVAMFAPQRDAVSFRVPPPPAMTSARYAAAYNEVKRLGGDGVVTPTERTEEQTRVAVFWAYDGTPSLCAPPRLYNQITVQIATRMGARAIELARLLALVNTSMADAGTAIWESKYYYQLWRPVTGIREADPGTGPTGDGDGNPATVGDLEFTPLGAPASNLQGPNFTPPFPAYPSGHAGFGGALFETLRRFYGTDDIRFTFVSDEFNGATLDNQGNARPLLPRSFRSLSQAEEENGQSRIYLGIHWAYDKEEGIAQGRAVADHVFRTLFQPLEPPSDG
jgi:hypothetical protein